MEWDTTGLLLPKRVAYSGWVLEESSAVDELCREYFCHEPGSTRYAGFVGMDMEWRPNSKRGQDNRTAVLQISDANMAMVAHLSRMKDPTTGRFFYLPRKLKEVLEDPMILKCGVGIAEDFKKLARHYDVKPQGFLDMALLAFGHLGVAGMGLQRLVAEFGHDLKKSRQVQRSDWQERLNAEQVAYAAQDAFASVWLLEQFVDRYGSGLATKLFVNVGTQKALMEAAEQAAPLDCPAALREKIMSKQQTRRIVKLEPKPPNATAQMEEGLTLAYVGWRMVRSCVGAANVTAEQKKHEKQTSKDSTAQVQAWATQFGWVRRTLVGCGIPDPHLWLQFTRTDVVAGAPAEIQVRINVRSRAVEVYGRASPEHELELRHAVKQMFINQLKRFLRDPQSFLAKGSDSTAPQQQVCDVCRVMVPTNKFGGMAAHIQGRSHQAKVALKHIGDAAMQAKLQENKAGVTIACSHVEPITCIQNEKVQVTYTVRNTNTDHCVRLKECCPLVPHRALEIIDQMGVGTGLNEKLLRPGEEYLVHLRCVSRPVCVLRAWMIFRCTVEPVASPPTDFGIGRKVTVHVMDKDRSATWATAILEPTSKYQRKRATKKPGKHMVPGVKPAAGLSMPKLINLPANNIPREVLDAVHNPTSPACAALAARLSLPLDSQTYAARQQLLLNLERAQEDIDIRAFDMEGVMLQAVGDAFKLQVPGLAEARPSVLRGDRVLVSLPTDTEQEYEGFVHGVHLETVSLKFDPSFQKNHIKNRQYHVRFTVRSMQVRLQLAAVRDAQDKLPPWLLFPGERVHNNTPPAARAAPAPLTRSAELNQEQWTAVEHALQAGERQLPYIIFGPPGTGKTRTLTEYVLQALRADPSARVLVTAPSNTATDVLAMRILERGTAALGGAARLLRVNAYQRDINAVPAPLRPCCRALEAGDGFRMPTADELLRARVVAATCMTAGKLGALEALQERAASGALFTHVALDEAGHAAEPEALCALVRLLQRPPDAGARPCGVVLAGDPRQLGPVIRSPLAIQHGMQVSLLARLMTPPPPPSAAAPLREPAPLPPHCENKARFPRTHGYDPQCITLLVNNYRSHPRLLQLPSALFYHDTLKPCANLDEVRGFVDWEGLPDASRNTDFPLLFHGMNGAERREDNSPSWFNPDEAMAVYRHIESLKARRPPVQDAEIGVITPYHKQKMKIRALLKKKCCDGVQVGSVEEFQGQEKLVIIISCVRSEDGHIPLDLKHNIGFLGNPQRFNVAITRAKALLVVVGNPIILAQDPHWGKFLQLCLRHGAYDGMDLPYWLEERLRADDQNLGNVRESGEEALLDALRNMALASADDFAAGTTDPEGGEGGGPSRVTEQENPAWRNEL